MTGEDRMDKQDMRAQFEAWVLREYPNQLMGRFSDGEYHSTTVQCCWLSWQASREAVEVELPDVSSYEVYDQKHDFLHTDEVTLMEAVIASIEAQGLKVKQ